MDALSFPKTIFESLFSGIGILNPPPSGLNPLGLSFEKTDEKTEDEADEPFGENKEEETEEKALSV